ncbi:MAG: ribose-phosphate pyrophosphokinase [Ignavibacteriales bacterium]|nr:ribose-phosphate pyrophosphokinase [Melioribacteraceae bacterium]RJP59679.1 MAG: ribose-phosphate pyrophosphokinase [Ignavibacteriales bacterium]
MESTPLIFSGSSNPELAKKITNYLSLPLGTLDLKRFSDGEIWAKYQENIRGRDVFIVQSTHPPADHLMELLILIDAARRASAKRVTAVIPYFGYARQDRKDQPRVAITAKLVANLLTVAGCDRIITMDLHAAQIQGFFDIPFDHLYASPVFTSIFKEMAEEVIMVSPDMGGIKLARSYAKRLNTNIVVLDKRRPEHNYAEVMHVIGDVDGKNVLLIDDLIDTGGTFVSAVSALKKHGAKNIYGTITHPVLSSDAVKRIEDSELDTLYVSDTIPLSMDKMSSKIVVRTVAELFAEAVIRSYRNESISSLFEIDKG